MFLCSVVEVSQLALSADYGTHLGTHREELRKYTRAFNMNIIDNLFLLFGSARGRARRVWTGR